MLLHTEYSLLSLLSNQENVVHHHGFFKVSLILETFYFFRYADSCEVEYKKGWYWKVNLIFGKTKHGVLLFGSTPFKSFCNSYRLSLISLLVIIENSISFKDLGCLFEWSNSSLKVPWIWVRFCSFFHLLRLGMACILAASITQIWLAVMVSLDKLGWRMFPI